MKSIILDTNIFVRYFLKDVVSQYSEAQKLVSKIEAGEIAGKVSILVIDELVWVLENYYKIPRKIFVPQILKVFALPGIKIMEAEKSIIMEIIEDMETRKFDFTDFYLARISGSEEIFSFDKDLLKIK